jgi:hypothetical protein
VERFATTYESACSTRIRRQAENLATAIDGTDPTASIETLMSVAPLFRLDEQDSVGVLREVLVATSGWRESAAERNIPKVEIDQMASALRARQNGDGSGAHRCVGQRAQRRRLTPNPRRRGGKRK